MISYTQYSVEEYKTALKTIVLKINDLQHRILKIQYEAPLQTVTATEIANKVGHKFSFINLQYGRLGRHVAEALQKMPHRREDGSFRWWSVLSMGQESPRGFLWEMHPSFVQALEELGWFESSVNSEGVKIVGKVRGLATFYSSGLERHEIHIDKKYAEKLPCKNGERVDINLYIGKCGYRAGIRITENNNYIWICPNLQMKTGKSITLAEVLRENEFVKNQIVHLNVSGSEIQLALPSNPVREIEEYKQSYENLAETERQAIVQSRIGQGRFRAKLIEYWCGCAITGCEASDVLKASHIKPWRISENNERLDVYNGLLLIPNLDSAFDNGLITFTDRGKIIISPLLDDKDRKKLGIHTEMFLKKIESQHIKYLEYHRINIFKDN